MAISKDHSVSERIAPDGPGASTTKGLREQLEQPHQELRFQLILALRLLSDLFPLI